MFSNKVSVDPSDAFYKAPTLDLANDMFDVLKRVMGESDARRSIITRFLMDNTIGSRMLVDSEAELVRGEHCVYIKCTNDREDYKHKANCIQAGHMIWHLYHVNGLIESSQED